MDHPTENLDFKERPAEEMLARSRAFLQEMKRRRSVRDYAPTPVAREIVTNAILTAGTAPSGAHKQPWHFVLVGNPEVKRRIREQAEIEERESYERRMPQEWLDDLAPLGTDWHKPFLTICPWLIVVFVENYGIHADTGHKSKNYYVQESVGISVGFLLAALHNAGLATLTHTPSPMGFLQKTLNRPKNEKAYMLIALGYPEEGCRVPVLRRKPAEAILTKLE